MAEQTVEEKKILRFVFVILVIVPYWSLVPSLVRNDNSNKGTTARLNETRFGPKKKSSPIRQYISAQKISTLFDEIAR